MYEVVGSLIIVFQPRSHVHPLPSMRQFSPMNSVKTLLWNSIGQEDLCNFMLIACDGYYQKNFFQAYC